MENKIILGMTVTDDTASLISHEFQHTEPKVWMEGYNTAKNFTLGFVFDDLSSENLFKKHKIKYIGCGRHDKSDQVLNLIRLNIQTIPTYKVSSSTDTISYYNLLKDYNDTDLFIIKPEGGARGVGQIRITKNDLYGLLDDVTDPNISDDELKSRYKVGGYERWDNEKSYFRRIIEATDFSIRRFIKITDEWRVVYLYKNDPIIIKRSRDSSHWQVTTANLSEEAIMDETVDPKILEYTEKLGSSLNTPWLSIDFYRDADGNIGVIEYQMQMGIRRVPKTDLLEKMLDSTRNLITDILYTPAVVDSIYNMDAIKHHKQILKNIRNNMTASKNSKIINWVLVQNNILTGTSMSGSTSAQLYCQYLGIDPDGYEIKLDSL